MTKELMDSNKNNWEITLEFYKRHLDIPLHIDEMAIDQIGHIYEARLRFQANINGQGMGPTYFNMFKDDSPTHLIKVNRILHRLLRDGKHTMADFDREMRKIYSCYI